MRVLLSIKRQKIADTEIKNSILGKSKILNKADILTRSKPTITISQSQKKLISILTKRVEDLQVTLTRANAKVKTLMNFAYRHDHALLILAHKFAELRESSGAKNDVLQQITDVFKGADEDVIALTEAYSDLGGLVEGHENTNKQSTTAALQQ